MAFADGRCLEQRWRAFLIQVAAGIGYGLTSAGSEVESESKLQRNLKLTGPVLLAADYAEAG
jgi:hypothetical protein